MAAIPFLPSLSLGLAIVLVFTAFITLCLIRVRVLMSIGLGAALVILGGALVWKFTQNGLYVIIFVAVIAAGTAWDVFKAEFEGYGTAFALDFAAVAVVAFAGLPSLPAALDACCGVIVGSLIGAALITIGLAAGAAFLVEYDERLSGQGESADVLASARAELSTVAASVRTRFTASPFRATEVSPVVLPKPGGDLPMGPKKKARGMPGLQLPSMATAGPTFGAPLFVAEVPEGVEGVAFALDASFVVIWTSSELRCINRDGSLRWSKPLSGMWGPGILDPVIRGLVQVVQGNNVVTVTGKGECMRYSADGAILNRASLSGELPSTSNRFWTRWGASALVAVSGWDLYCLDLDWRVKWKASLPYSASNVELSTDGSVVAVGLEDGRLLILGQQRSLILGERLWDRFAVATAPVGVALSADGTRLLSWTVRGSFYWPDPTSELKLFDSSGKLVWCRRFGGHITHAVASADQKVTAVRMETKGTGKAPLRVGKTTERLRGPTITFTTFLVDPAGRRLATLSPATKGTALYPDSVSDDGSRIAARGTDHNVYVFDARGRRILRQPLGEKWLLELSPGGSLAAFSPDLRTLGVYAI